MEKIQRTFWIDTKLFKKVKVACFNKNMSLSSLVNELLTKWVKEVRK